MKKQVNELSLERANALLGDKKINEETLKKMTKRIKVFCKVSYQLYLKECNADKLSIVKQLEVEPPDEFANAA